MPFKEKDSNTTNFSFVKGIFNYNNYSKGNPVDNYFFKKIMSSKYEDLEKAKKLYDDGVISQEEWEQEKSKLLAQPSKPTPSPNNSGKYWGMEENSFCMLMHLSWLVPVVGIFLPIVMWLTHKEISVNVDTHGRNLANFLLSYFIWFFVSSLLIFLIIGGFLLPILYVLSLVFTIIAAIKAYKGECWNYPLAIKFFKSPDTE